MFDDLFLQALFRRSQLKAMLDIHGTEYGFGGDLSEDEITVIRGALDLSHKTATSCMTPLEKACRTLLDAHALSAKALMACWCMPVQLCEQRVSPQAVSLMQSARHGAICTTCKVTLHLVGNAKRASRLPEQFQMVLPRRCSCSARMLLWMRHCYYQSWSLATAGCLCTSQAAGEHRPLLHAVIYEMVVDPPLDGPTDSAGKSWSYGP